MDALLDEIDRLRGELNYHDGQPGVSPKLLTETLAVPTTRLVVMCFRWLGAEPITFTWDGPGSDRVG
jgi:hypothetical protein